MKTGIARLLPGDRRPRAGLVVPNDPTDASEPAAAAGAAPHARSPPQSTEILRPRNQSGPGIRDRRRRLRGGAGLIAARRRQDLQEPAGGAERLDHVAPRRGGRPARPERRRQDHDVLHDRRPGAARHRLDQPGRHRHHHAADVSPRPPRHRLPAAGSQRVPRPERRAERHGRAGGGRTRPATGAT